VIAAQRDDGAGEDRNVPPVTDVSAVVAVALSHVEPEVGLPGRGRLGLRDSGGRPDGGPGRRASRLALRGDDRHFVSLDKALKTMRDTGRDMLDKYKETSRGGLAVNVIEC
jgi:hypothetical protein